MSEVNITSEQFWKAIKIWMKNSHVINRRLTGTITILNAKHSNATGKMSAILKKAKNLKYELLVSGNIDEIVGELFNNTNDVTVLSDDELDDGLCHFEDVSCIYVRIQICLPRSSKYKGTFRICLLDLSQDMALFVSVASGDDLINLAPEFTYSLKLVGDTILLETPQDLKEEDSSKRWLTDRLLPRIIKWSVSEANNNNGITAGSISLVSIDKYNTKYQDLKNKYGQEMVKIWPENTDPSKFVFEDVAIATYLLLLWEDERRSTGNTDMQSFIDLGCGNGLLVYILASEGHPGRGVDVRKRGIWDLYPDFVKLMVEPVTPSEECLYENTDWLIGNHSDELTPWIPVLAARSSYNCKFFLLPCCAFEFDGKKYQRVDSSKSQYNEYLEYVKLICNKCGIKTDIDRLKIPSTKRICLIGSERLYAKDNHNERTKEIQQFIDERCKKCVNSKTDDATDDKRWSANFKPRDSVERVRNCTKIGKGIINEIISIVSTNLLNEKNYCNGKWNAGGCVAVSDVVKFVSPEMLKLLKKECGGLQTLLKNNHHIFEVLCGNVKLRYPRTKAEVLMQFSKARKDKKVGQSVVLNQKPCWFYDNHPDGCPLASEHCSFLHGPLP